jgi:hypothetical protein
MHTQHTLRVPSGLYCKRNYLGCIMYMLLNCLIHGICIIILTNYWQDLSGHWSKSLATCLVQVSQVRTYSNPHLGQEDNILLLFLFPTRDLQRCRRCKVHLRACLACSHHSPRQAVAAIGCGGRFARHNSPQSHCSGGHKRQMWQPKQTHAIVSVAATSVAWRVVSAS